MQAVSNTWYEKTDCRLLNMGVGLWKLGSGGALAYWGISMAPRAAAVAILASSTALDLIPTLKDGFEVEHSVSYQSKTASVLRGAQLTAFVYLFSQTLDRADRALEIGTFGWNLLDSNFITTTVGGGGSGLFLLFTLYLASASTELERDEGYHARCPGCRVLDCEPTWDLPRH